MTALNDNEATLVSHTFIVPGHLLAACKSFTKAELKALQRLADRIKCDLTLMQGMPHIEAWAGRQLTALSVVEERIKHGR